MAGPSGWLDSGWRGDVPQQRETSGERRIQNPVDSSKQAEESSFTLLEAGAGLTLRSPSGVDMPMANPAACCFPGWLAH